MNDTLGPEGFVPTVLVFGEYPPVHTKSERPKDRLTLLQRSKLASEARKECESIMAKMKLARAQSYRASSADKHKYEPGNEVLVWRERVQGKRLGEWMGPYYVIDVDYASKQVIVRDCAYGPPRPFSLWQVKPYLRADSIATAFMEDIHAALSSFSSPADFDVHITEVLHPTDPRCHSVEMSAAKKIEIKGLLDRGAFRIMLKEDLPKDANVLPGRFVLAIKSTDDGQVKFKARYVIGGHRDKLKQMMVHSTSTLQPHSIRLLLALSVAFDFPIWTSDIRQAYLQSSIPLSREVFIRSPVPEFELKPEECLQLLKPLYGLCESGDIWHATMDRHHREDLGMTAFKLDPALYYIMSDEVLSGLSGAYVDDFIRSGDSRFREISRRTNSTFDMSDNEELPCTFSGFVLNRNTDGEISIDQRNYLRKLETLTLDATFASFRSMRMRLAWLSHTRPDCLFMISQLAQVTESIFENERSKHIRILNKAVRHAKREHNAITIKKLDVHNFRLIGFSDASFANNADLSTQLGYVLFLGDSSNRVIPLYFKSYKARRVVNSAMAGEVISFADLFDTASAIASDLNLVLQADVKIQLLTDRKSLFDVISKGSRTSQKRTMIEIASAREGFRDRVISDIGFVRSQHNLADALTKPMSQANLISTISSGELEVSPDQWIIRG